MKQDGKDGITCKPKGFLGEKLREMKALWENTTTTAKKRLDDLRVRQSNSKLVLISFVAEQRRKLEHICRKVPDPSDSSDNGPEAD